jgi:hypothetical protein
MAALYLPNIQNSRQIIIMDRFSSFLNSVLNPRHGPPPSNQPQIAVKQLIELTRNETTTN